jgi:hypothetical protein
MPTLHSFPPFSLQPKGIERMLRVSKQISRKSKECGSSEEENANVERSEQKNKTI